MKDQSKILEIYNDPQAVEKYIKNTPAELPQLVKLFIDKFLSLCSDNSLILEIGSGTGGDADYIQKRGYRIIASDASDIFLKYIHKNTTLEILKIDILSDELPDAIEAVYLNSVLHHLNNIEAQEALNKINSKLPEGGLLAFMTRSGTTEGLINEKVGAPRYFKYRTENEIEGILKICGYKIMYLKTMDSDVGEFLYCIARKIPS